MWNLAGEPLQSLRAEGVLGGYLRSCLYVNGVQKFVLVTGAQGQLSLSSALEAAAGRPIPADRSTWEMASV